MIVAVVPLRFMISRMRSDDAPEIVLPPSVEKLNGGYSSVVKVRALTCEQKTSRKPVSHFKSHPWQGGVGRVFVIMLLPGSAASVIDLGSIMIVLSLRISQA